MIGLMFRCLAAFCLIQSSVVASITSQQKTNEALIKDFISSDWQRVSSAKAMMESRQAEAIPLLIQILERDEKVDLHNTADLDGIENNEVKRRSLGPDRSPTISSCSGLAMSGLLC